MRSTSNGGRWTYRAGTRPHTVTVYERADRGDRVYARTWVDGKPVKSALPEGTSRSDAVAYAEAEAERLAAGATALRHGRVTLGTVFDLYLDHRSPRKGTDKGRKADRRKAELWGRVLGRDTDPHDVSLREWDGFIRDRTAGAVNARGEAVAEPERKPVRARTVEADCDWLRWVFSWASKWRTEQGTYLMRENPLRGFESPAEADPRRGVMSHDRFLAIRAKSDDVTMEVRWNGKRETRRSYLSELLDLANGTGRRLSSILALRFDDLHLTDGTPHGSIRWRRDVDKMGRESTVPIGPDVRAALDRILKDRPGVGQAPLFPSPTEAAQPMSRYLARDWFAEAEQAAGLEPMDGTQWHAIRRKWATERKHLPDVDVAAAGGWKGTETLKRAYQQADEDGMLSVVLGGGELRERKA